MKFPSGIRVSEPTSYVNFDRYRFELIEENQEIALRGLLKWLTPDCKLFLSDHRRGDSEGGVTVELRGGRFQYMRGGHGYSSDWCLTSEDEVLGEMLEAVKATKWGALLGNGNISIYKNT